MKIISLKKPLQTYQEFQIELIKIGLTIKELATLIGMNPNSITNYKSKEIIPLNLAITVSLISSLKSNGIDPELAINEVKRNHFKDFLQSNKNKEI
ncbi:tellurium resistance protein TerC [Acinetobacter baumannii]|nr:tellurium resistance protein TerC [Acinetobacter baumannii]